MELLFCEKMKSNDPKCTFARVSPARGHRPLFFKDNAGLTYAEIVNYPGFSDVKVSSLGAIYRDAKIRMEKK